MFPFGATTLNVTLAPEAKDPPLTTVAESGTDPGSTKFAPETDSVTANEGGITTVAFAVSVELAAEFDAVRFTAYVPAGVPEGEPFPMVSETDCPGFSVGAEEEKEVDHPEGSLEDIPKVLAAQAVESLLVTVTE